MYNKGNKLTEEFNNLRKEIENLKNENAELTKKLNESSPPKMNITIVDSVKGGCGKTSISLKYAIKFAEKSPGKVCYIDLDLLGSSIEVFVKGNKFVGCNNEDKKKLKYPIWLEVQSPANFYLNEIFNGQKFSNRFLSNIKVCNSTDSDSNVFFHLIACNPQQNEKDRFKPSRLMNYVGQIDYEYFAAMIENVLNKLEKMEYEYVIIDMPPNSDAYTDSLFNILLRSNSTEKYETKYNVEICVVNSYDIAHFAANLEWLKNMIEERDMRWNFNPSKLFKIVFNNNVKIDHNDNEIKGYILNKELELKGLKISEIRRFDFDNNNFLSTIRGSGVGFGQIIQERLDGNEWVQME